MNRAEFQALADVRLAEAQALLAFTPPLPDGAYYLAGYAVECGLKAAIAKLNREFDWPDRKFVIENHTHDLAVLMKNAALNAEFTAAEAADPRFRDDWEIARAWTERSRYERWPLDEA